MRREDEEGGWGERMKREDGEGGGGGEGGKEEGKGATTLPLIVLRDRGSLWCRAWAYPTQLWVPASHPSRQGEHADPIRRMLLARHQREYGLAQHTLARDVTSFIKKV